jgi:hypothetical protein
MCFEGPEKKPFSIGFNLLVELWIDEASTMFNTKHGVN